MRRWFSGAATITRSGPVAMSVQPWSAGFRMGRHPLLLLVAAVVFAVVAAMMPKPVRNRIDDWLAGFRRHDTTWPRM